MNRCLFSLFWGNSSFRPSKNIEPETFTIAPTCIPDLQFCVVSFVLDPLGYPSNTTAGQCWLTIVTFHISAVLLTYFIIC